MIPILRRSNFCLLFLTVFDFFVYWIDRKHSFYSFDCGHSDCRQRSFSIINLSRFDKRSLNHNIMIINFQWGLRGGSVRWLSMMKKKKWSPISVYHNHVTVKRINKELLNPVQMKMRIFISVMKFCKLYCFISLFLFHQCDEVFQIMLLH